MITRSYLPVAGREIVRRTANSPVSGAGRGRLACVIGIGLTAWFGMAPHWNAGSLSWSIPEARADNVSYAHDASGRLIQASDATSLQAVMYGYDAAGNITSQRVVPLGTLAVSGTSADQGAAGTQLMIYGTGFSPTASNDTVSIGGITATVVSATQTQLIVTIPAGAASGQVTVKTGSSTVNSPTAFTATPNAIAPTITSFSPGSGVAGTTVSVTGSAFMPTTSDDMLRFNAADARVTAATATSLTATVPNETSSGPLEVVTPYGAASSTADFIVPPSGYSASSVAVVAHATENGGSVSVALGAGQVGLVLFKGTGGDQYVRAVIPTQASLIEVLDPVGKVLASGCSTNCLYDLPPTLNVTGTYNVVIGSASSTVAFPVGIVTAITGDIDLSWSEEGEYVWNDAVNAGSYQRTILTFSGAAGQLTEIDFRELYNSLSVSLLSATGQTLWSSTIPANTASVTIPALPQNGTYSVAFDPQLNGECCFQYNAGIVAPAPLAVNGPTMTVSGGGPILDGGGPAAKVTFSGTAGQQLNLTATASQGFYYYLNVYYVTSSGQQCLGTCSELSGGSCTVNLPTLPVTGTYLVYLQFRSAYYSSVNMNLSTTLASSSVCSGGIAGTLHIPEEGARGMVRARSHIAGGDPARQLSN